MYRIILAGFLALAFVTTDNDKLYNLSKQRTVYICTGKYSKKYHYDNNCIGLSNCKSDVIEVSLKEAKVRYERTLCGLED